jgi:hypothetical protein
MKDVTRLMAKVCLRGARALVDCEGNCRSRGRLARSQAASTLRGRFAPNCRASCLLLAAIDSSGPKACAGCASSRLEGFVS